MSLARKIFTNTLIQFVGRAATAAFGILSVALLTRYLGVAGYGDYTTVFAFVSFAAVLADAGFFALLLRELSQEGADESHLVSNILTARTFLGLAVFVLTSLIGWFVPQYDQIVRVGIPIIGFASLWTAMNQTVVALFQRHLRMDLAVIAELVARTALVAGLWFVLRLDAGLTIVFWVYVAANAANFALSVFFARSFIQLRPAFDFATWRRVALEALPIGIVLILHIIYFKVDAVLLSLMRGNTDVGIYGAPYKIVDVLVTVPVMFLGNVFPALTLALGKDFERAHMLFVRAFQVLALLAAPVALIGAALASQLLHFVAGESYVTTATVSWLGQPATGATALKILFLAVGIAFFSSLMNYSLVAAGKQRSLILPNTVLVIVNIGLNLIFIPKYSYVGTALATVITEAVAVTYLAILVRQQVGLIAPLRSLIAPLVASAVAAWCGVYLLSQASFFLALIGSTGVYLVFVWLLGAIPTELRAVFKPTIR